MGNISVSLPSDGTTADVSDYNTPINAIVNEFNGNIDNSNIKAGAAIDGSKLADTSIPTAKLQDSSVSNAKLKTGAGEPGGAWDTWTPTLSGRFNNSKWTKNCKYKRVGNTVFCKFYVTANTTTPMDGSGDAVFTLPVPAVTYPGQPFGKVSLDDSGAATYPGGTLRFSSSTTVDILIENVGSTYAALNGITNTVPYTWTTNDSIFALFSYEAAP